MRTIDLAKNFTIRRLYMHSGNPTRSILRIAATLSMLLLFHYASPAFGQAEQGTLTGTVTDTTGAVVKGAKVTVRNTATQVTSSTLSTESGLYTIPYLTPGTYNVSAESSGFSVTEIVGVNLTVNLTARIDIALKPGAVDQTVSVAANAIQLETENAEVGVTIDRQQIIELPQLGRNPYNLLSLSPGVLPISGGTGTENIISGGRSTTAAILLDGGNQINSTTGLPNYTPPLEAVGQFKVITNSFSAEYGRAGAGVITAATVAGTNTLHGSVYEYFRNNDLNANSWANKYFRTAIPVYHENNYGFSVGGPVFVPRLYDGRSRTFFFFNFEEDPASTPNVFTGTVPTLAERNGDFSGLVDASGSQIVIYDPTTTVVNSSSPSGYSRSPFPGNVIPPGRINSIAASALAYYPNPTNSSQTNNYILNRSSAQKSDNFIARVDQNITANNKFFVRVGRNAVSVISPPANAAFPRQGTNGPGGGQAGAVTFANWTGVVSDTWTISPTLLGEFRVNFSRMVNATQPFGRGFDSTSLGFPSSVTSQFESKLFPAFDIGDISPLGADRASDFTDAEGTNEAQASLTWVKGPQTINVGFDYAFPYFNVTRPERPAGQFTFGREFTQGPDVNTASTNGGFGLATFLLGLPDGGQVTNSPSLAASQKDIAAYVEDDWKIIPKLTLNLGLRYDYQDPWTERHNKLAYFDPTAPSPIAGAVGSLEFTGLNGNPRTQKSPVYTNFAPRLGFAYQVDPKTSVRGAYGFFYLPGSGGVGGGASDLGLGWLVSTPLYLGPPAANQAPSTPVPGATLNNPFVAGYQVPPNDLLGEGIYDPERRGTIPLQEEWNASIQRSIASSTVLEAAYIGNRCLHIWSDLSINAPALSNQSLGNALFQQVTNPYAGKLPGYLGAPTVSYSQLLRPFPQYADVVYNRKPAGDSTYHAFTLKATHQDSRGLYFQVSYTISKEIDDVNERFFGRANPVRDPSDLTLSRAIAEWDRSQFLVFNYVYQLPFGRGKQFVNKGLASYLLGNWQFSGITQYGKGLPVVISSPGNSGLPDIGNYAERLHDPHLKGGGQKSSRWFDTTAYGIPANFTIGNGDRTEPKLRGPALGHWDIGVTRKQPITEKVDLALRFEFFNAFNNRELGSPDGNVTSQTFGQILSSGNPRNIQIGARLAF